MFRGHGIPSVLISDQGKNVDGEGFREMCRKYGIKKCHTSPLPSSARWNGRETDWAREAGDPMPADGAFFRRRFVANAAPGGNLYCNNIENGANGIAPHLLAFGRRPRTPLDARIDTANKKTQFPGRDMSSELLRGLTWLRSLAHKT